MGIIEDSIFAIYRKALEEGDIKQAEKAVEIAGIVKRKVEQEGFVDPVFKRSSIASIPGNFFEPYPYRYYPDEGVVVLTNSAINLTPSENKLFGLFSSNESRPDQICLITKDEIKQHLWGVRTTSEHAVRISVLRLRRRIETANANQKMLVSVYSRGYIFFGKRLWDAE